METKTQTQRKKGTKTKIKTRNFFIVLLLIFTVTLTSAAQCNDGIDNDLDGNIDHPADSGCSTDVDNSESVILGYAHGCLTDGDQLLDVFGNTRYECSSTTCIVCVLMTEAGNYTTLPSKCSGLPQCGFNGGSNGGGSPGLDVDAPNLTLNNPTQGTIYDNRKILLDIDSSERADLYYLDLVNGRGRWTRICNSCRTYSKQRSFKEGLNQLRFRGTDRAGNIGYKDINFTIDSKDPKISKTSPTSGFIASTFSIEFKELNPENLTLHYGNTLTGFISTNVNLETCDKEDEEEYTCNKEVDLSSYDGQDIHYWFNITDIAGNKDESKKNEVSVDQTAPIINNPTSFYTLQGKHVYFNISITENNLEEVYYKDNNDLKAKNKRLCSKLKNGRCEKKISFKDGDWNIDVGVQDEAGNEVTERISFFIDSKDPSITKTTPKKKAYTSGTFEVSFKELNPTTLTLHYGEENTTLDINNDCNIHKGIHTCDKEVDLTSYDGETLTYWFSLIDRVGNKDESKATEVNVDTTHPVLNNPEDFYTIEGKRVYFSLNITEENVEEIYYTYLDSRGRLKEKRLCSKLKNGLCEKRLPFKEGEHDITINIIDEAGNAIAQATSFTITG